MKYYRISYQTQKETGLIKLYAKDENEAKEKALIKIGNPEVCMLIINRKKPQREKVKKKTRVYKTGKARRYRPAYFSGFEEEVITFNTLKQLLGCNWIKNFTNNKTFFRYSVSNDLTLLIAEYKKGYEWWVIANIINPIKELYDLPQPLMLK